MLSVIGPISIYSIGIGAIHSLLFSIRNLEKGKSE